MLSPQKRSVESDYPPLREVVPGETIAGMADTDQEVPQPTHQERKGDYGLYVGILFGIVSVFFFVLQSNGVEVTWLWSVFAYLICTVIVVWSTLYHALPGKGKATRYAVTLGLVLICGVLGTIGSMKQYGKEHPALASKELPNAPPAPSPRPNTSPASPIASPKSDTPGKPVDLTPPISGPWFVQKVDRVTAAVGSYSLTNTIQQYRDAVCAPLVYHDFKPVRVYAKGDTVYVDADLSGGPNTPDVQFRHNKLSIRPWNWDINQSERALEIVNENGVVMFQYIRKRLDYIQVNGMFGLPNGKVLLLNESDSGELDRVPSRSVIKPIFRYPSWKYPGMYVSETVGDTHAIDGSKFRITRTFVSTVAENNQLSIAIEFLNDTNASIRGASYNTYVIWDDAPPSIGDEMMSPTIEEKMKQWIDIQDRIWDRWRGADPAPFDTKEFGNYPSGLSHNEFRHDLTKRYRVDEVQRVKDGKATLFVLGMTAYLIGDQEQRIPLCIYMTHQDGKEHACAHHN